MPELAGVGIEEKSGEQIPRDISFRDETGAAVDIGALLDGERPVLLTFYYSKCPMLCSVQLGDLVDVLNNSKWVVGDKFRIVSVSLDPNETHAMARETKEGYLDRYRAPDVPSERRFKPKSAAGGAQSSAESDADNSHSAIADNWTFLTGDQTAIDRLAKAVGFNYNYVPRKREYAHPTAIIVLTPTGVIASYLHGLSYKPEDLNARVVSAALEQPTASTAQYIFSCFHFVEPSGLTAIALSAMRYAGLFFVALLGGVLVFLHRRRRTHGQTKKPAQ